MIENIARRTRSRCGASHRRDRREPPVIRRRFCLAAATAGIVLLASGCVTSGSPSADQPRAADTSPEAEVTGQLEVVSFQPEGSSMWDRYEKLAAEFEDEHPGVTVKLTFG